METGIQKYSNLSPASFVDKDKKLTIGQQNLLDLLVEKISQKEPITQEDIIDCYFKTVSRNGNTIRVRGNMHYGSFYCNEVDKNNNTAKSRANTWFKQNLGSVIIKGRLLVIPVIKIE